MLVLAASSMRELATRIAIAARHCLPRTESRTLLVLSSLCLRMESANVRKMRSIRRGKRPARPTTSRPIINNDHSSLKPEPKLKTCRLRAAARLHAFGHEQFLRMKRPAPTPPIARVEDAATATDAGSETESWSQGESVQV